MVSMKTNLFILICITSLIPRISAAAINDGVWKTECRLGLKKRQTVQGLTIVSTEEFHQDSACTQPTFNFETSGINRYSSNEAGFVDFTYSQITLSVFIPEAVEDLNARKVCGLDNWKTGKAQNITGLNCPLFDVNKETPIPKIGDLKYGIYSVKNKRLYYGILTKEFDGSTPLKRPRLLNTEFYELNESVLF